MIKKCRKRKLAHLDVLLLLAALLVGGCTTHYPTNSFLKECSPDSGYRLGSLANPNHSDPLVLFLTFSGGGTRAASLAYGVLEELDNTQVILAGEKKFLLDEVDVISGVSGGSFTAVYYGLFGRRIFQDFEDRFLKKNIQKELFLETLKPKNWFRLLSGNFGRNDLAAEYYDQNIFEGKTFHDILTREGPLILVNATDITLGTHFTFSQDIFDIICSDVCRLPVARAVAASSAVPILLSPITMYNFSGSCNYEVPDWMKKSLKNPEASRRQFQRALHYQSYMDVNKRPYIHLMDGGLSDNLGLRAVMDRIADKGDIWTSFKKLGWQNAQKIVFIMVNAGKEPDERIDHLERTLPSAAVMKSVSRNSIIRYNFETFELLREYTKRWKEEIRTQRCNEAKAPGVTKAPPSDPASCSEIEFYLVEVNFDSLPDEAERAYFAELPTSFNLPPNDVDKLRTAARRLLQQSPEFQRLLWELR